MVIREILSFKQWTTAVEFGWIKIVPTNAHSRWFSSTSQQCFICHGNWTLYNRERVVWRLTATATNKMLCATLCYASEVVPEEYPYKLSAAVFFTGRSYHVLFKQYLILNYRLCTLSIRLHKEFYCSISEYVRLCYAKYAKGLWNLKWKRSPRYKLILNAHVQRTYESVEICMQDITETHTVTTDYCDVDSMLWIVYTGLRMLQLFLCWTVAHFWYNQTRRLCIPLAA